MFLYSLGHQECNLMVNGSYMVLFYSAWALKMLYTTSITHPFTQMFSCNFLFNIHKHSHEHCSRISGIQTGAARNQTSILLSCSTYWATIAHWHLQSLSLFDVPQTTLWTLMYWKRKPLAWPSVLRIGIILLWWYGVQIFQFFHEWLWIERGFIKQGTQYVQLRKANVFHRSLPGKTTKRKKDNLWITASRF